MLSGTEASERSGYWYTLYKEVEGDSERMDITPWIEVVPEEYTIGEGETVTTTIRVSIPADAEPGLWGATSPTAGEQGHSDERRTYLVFKDTVAGGNVYSGLLIPVSVSVAGTTNPLTAIIEWVRDNLTVTVLAIAIVILASLLLRRRHATGK